MLLLTIVDNLVCWVESQAKFTGDIKHRKTHKSKAFFVIQKILTFDSHQYTPL